MNNIILLYSLFVTTLISITTFSTASSSNEYTLATLFLPLPIYFLSRILQSQVRTARLKRLKSSQVKQSKSLVKQSQAIEGEIISNPSIKDIDKRLFLKLIGSGGVTLFMMSLFTKKTHAAFFGSVPGPGTVSIKDSSGTPIDPAEKQPTDGYEITELDESDATYSYYGFVEKEGAWYIARENKTTGSYRYAKGTSDFSTGWTNKASQTYDYFDSTF